MNEELNNLNRDICTGLKDVIEALSIPPIAMTEEQKIQLKQEMDALDKAVIRESNIRHLREDIMGNFIPWQTDAGVK